LQNVRRTEGRESYPQFVPNFERHRIKGTKSLDLRGRNDYAGGSCVVEMTTQVTINVIVRHVRAVQLSGGTAMETYQTSVIPFAGYVARKSRHLK
jgi:hypothetical protein